MKKNKIHKTILNKNRINKNNKIILIYNKILNKIKIKQIKINSIILNKTKINKNKIHNKIHNKTFKKFLYNLRI